MRAPVGVRSGRLLAAALLAFAWRASAADALINGTGNSTNTTAPDEYDCEKWRPVPYVFIAILPIWALAGAYWFFTITFRYPDIALDLHRLLLWVPAVEVAHGVLSVAYYWMCPWPLPFEKVVAAAWVVVAILKEPIMLVCLLMVAKGWCITRPHLSSRESAHSSLVVTLLYASVIVQMSVRSLWAVAPMVLMYALMLCNVMSAVLTNLRVLKAQLLALHRLYNIDATTTPAYVKYRMFSIVFWASGLYFLLDIVLFIAGILSDAQGTYEPWLTTLLRQLLELIASLLIGYAFRCRPLNNMFEVLNQLASDLATQMLPQISTATLDLNELRGDGTVPWSRGMDLEAAAAAAPPDVLVVLNPGIELPAGDSDESGGLGDGSLVFATKLGGAAAEAEPEARSSAVPMATYGELLRGALSLPEWRGGGRAGRSNSNSSPRGRSNSGAGGGRDRASSGAGRDAAGGAGAAGAAGAGTEMQRPPRMAASAPRVAPQSQPLPEVRVSLPRPSASGEAGGREEGG